MIDDDDAVGEGVGLLQVLGGEQHGDPFAEELADGVPHPLAAGRVETGRRFVQEQHGRTGHQAGREVEPAAHTTGVPLEDPVGGIGQFELREQLGRACTGPRTPHVAELADQDQVLAAGEQPVQGGVLRGDPDVAPDLCRVGHHVDAGDGSASRVRHCQRGQDPDRGRLACTVGPEQSEDRPGCHREADPCEGLGLPVALDQPLGLDHHVGRHRWLLPYRSISRLLTSRMVS